MPLLRLSFFDAFQFLGLFFVVFPAPQTLHSYAAATPVGQLHVLSLHLCCYSFHPYQPIFMRLLHSFLIFDEWIYCSDPIGWYYSASGRRGRSLGHISLLAEYGVWLRPGPSYFHSGQNF
jgi:hypothetical protein